MNTILTFLKTRKFLVGVGVFVGLGVGIASSLVHFYQNHKSEKHKDQFLEAWRTRTELRKKYPDKFKTPYSGLEEEI